MRLNDIGRVLGTNDVQIGTEQVTKRFNQFALSMLWGFLERKPFLSARARYEREKRMVDRFAGHPELNTPTLLEADDEELILVFKTLNLTSLVEIFQDSSVHVDDKFEYLRAALGQLHAIHDANEIHGDSYLKNFFRVDGADGNGHLYTCDFEYERGGPDPAVTDLMILTANSINALFQADGSSPKPVLSLVKEVYGDEIHFPFDIRDRIFFSLRFGMGAEFFEHFSRGRKIL